jgi:flagellar biosynthesis/type III secretory pathway protein FliH
MIGRPAGLYLVEFDCEIAPEVAQTSTHDPPLPVPQEQNATDLAEQIKSAYARGRDEGAASVRAEFQTWQVEERARFVSQLSDQRKAWAAEEAQVLANGIRDGLRQIESTLADAATEILKPFLTIAVQHQVMGELRQLLASIMPGKGEITIHISGPEDLAGKLRESLSRQGISIKYTVSESCEVRIAIARTTIETRLGAWLSRVSEAVE